MRPAQPWTSDTLVHHASRGSFINILTGSLETWGQWGSGGDLDACHVEGFFDELQIARMNPKVSVLYPADQAPWDCITVLRLDLARFFQFGVPRYPGQDPEFIKNFQQEVNENLGQPYAWGQIFRFSWIGILARIWPSKAQELLKSKNDDVLKNHVHVCSQWWTERIENTVKKTYGKLHESLANYDLFEGTNVGDGEERPADYIKSQDLKPV